MRDYYDEDIEIFEVDDEYDTSLKEKLGDALYYGLLEEVPKMVRDSDSWYEGSNLMACLAYLHLEGIISVESLRVIFDEIQHQQSKFFPVKFSLKMISEKILLALSQHYEFQNLDQLVDKMNVHKLPDWSSLVGGVLDRKYYSGLFLCDSHLYYIVETEGKEMFCKLDISRKFYDYSAHIDTNRKKVVMGYGYRRIYAYDKDLKRFYLEPANQEGVYHCYDVYTNTFTIMKGEFVTLKMGFPYIITEDKYFARVENETVKKLKKCEPNELFCERENGFLVRPKDRNKKFFYPYVMDLDGGLQEADEKECRQIIWDRLNQVARAEAGIFDESTSDEPSEYEKIPTPETLSVIDVFRGIIHMRDDSYRCDNKKYLLFKNVLAFIKSFVDIHEDITKLWYVLYDIDRGMNSAIHSFPSEDFYWQLKTLVTTERKKTHLKNIVKSGNYEELRKLFGIADYSERERVKSKGKIGVFHMENGEAEAKAVPIFSGKVFGTHVMPLIPASKEDGTISYDSLQNRYYVTFRRALRTQEKLWLMREFEIPEENITYFVNTQ